jgi:hypothetical protein
MKFFHFPGKTRQSKKKIELKFIMISKLFNTTRLQIKQLKLNNYTKTYTKIIIMATTLIDTRKSIMDQIHASWNQFRTTEAAYELMFGGRQYYEDTQRIPLAEEFKKSDSPWSSKQSVLEKNTVHANKLIRLYIALNIDVAYRVPIWQFFEIQNGVVGRIKDEIKLLKRVQKVLKLEQELEVHEPLPNATSLFTHTASLLIDDIEKDLKVKVKEAKKLAAKAAKAHAKAVKALAATQDKAATKAKKLVLKAGIQAAKKGAKRVARVEKKLAATQAKAAKKLASEQAKAAKALAATEAKEFKAAEKLENKLAKKTIALLKWAQANNYTIEDIAFHLNNAPSARSNNNMVTIIDIHNQIPSI